MHLDQPRVARDPVHLADLGHQVPRLHGQAEPAGQLTVQPVRARVGLGRQDAAGRRQEHPRVRPPERRTWRAGRTRADRSAGRPTGMSTPTTSTSRASAAVTSAEAQPADPAVRRRGRRPSRRGRRRVRGTRVTAGSCQTAQHARAPRLRPRRLRAQGPPDRGGCSALGYEVVDHGPVRVRPRRRLPAVRAAGRRRGGQRHRQPRRRDRRVRQRRGRSPPTRSPACGPRWRGTTTRRRWAASTTTPTSSAVGARMHIARRGHPAGRAVPHDTVQRRRAARPPDRDDRGTTRRPATCPSCRDRPRSRSRRLRRPPGTTAPGCARTPWSLRGPRSGRALRPAPRRPARSATCRRGRPHPARARRAPGRPRRRCGSQVRRRRCRPVSRQRPAFQGQTRSVTSSTTSTSARVGAGGQRAGRRRRAGRRARRPSSGLARRGFVQPVHQRVVDRHVPQLGAAHQVEVEQVAVQRGQRGRVRGHHLAHRRPALPEVGAERRLGGVPGVAADARRRPRRRRSAARSCPSPHRLGRSRTARVHHRSSRANMPGRVGADGVVDPAVELPVAGGHQPQAQAGSSAGASGSSAVAPRGTVSRPVRGRRARSRSGRRSAARTPTGRPPAPGPARAARSAGGHQCAEHAATPVGGEHPDPADSRRRHGARPARSGRARTPCAMPTSTSPSYAPMSLPRPEVRPLRLADLGRERRPERVRVDVGEGRPGVVAEGADRPGPGGGALLAHARCLPEPVRPEPQRSSRSDRAAP